MGAGKSSVGRAVAEMLNFQFVDTDELIESKAGRRISDIFAQDGEPAFRQLESEVVQGLTRLTSTLIATGGGLPVNPANLESLKCHALVVCLWATPERIFERVHNQTHRPLLQVRDPVARIRELLEERTPFYRQADVLIGTDGRTVREVAQQVVTQFRLAQRAGP